MLVGILWFRGLKTFSFNSDFDSIESQHYYSGGVWDHTVRIRDVEVHEDGSVFMITNDRQNARIRKFYNRNFSDSDIVLEDISINIFPNPVADMFTITGFLSDYSIEILNSSGQTFQQINPFGDSISIDVNTLPTGLCFIKFTNHNHNRLWVEKILKQ